MSDLRPQLASSGSLNKLNPFTNKLVQCSRLNASHDDFDKIPSPIAALRRSAFKRAAAQLKALCVQASGCSIEGATFHVQASLNAERCKAGMWLGILSKSSWFAFN